ncbi:hypothetical protein WAB17_08620 [Parerythrobacter aurantius]|uniref:COG3650 family protein n=1 Tax=Parerythrobacter aurantius TaxID=3127706 RepID=UPI00324FC9EE
MRIVLPVILLLVAACHNGETEGAVPGTSPQGFTAIAPDEVITVGGTEPFWGGTVDGETFLYTTPESMDGTAIAVARFTGQGGLGFSGTLGGQRLDLLITQGECSDGMSDRTYPFVATLKIGEDVRQGCAHTDRQPFSGPAMP